MDTFDKVTRENIAPDPCQDEEKGVLKDKDEQNPLDNLIPWIISYRNSLKSYEHKIQDLVEQQQLLIGKINTENARYKDMELAVTKLQHLFQLVTHYTQKLKQLQHEIITMTDKMQKLKQRASIVQSQQELKQKELAKLREQQEEREKLLTARPIWETPSS